MSGTLLLGMETDMAERRTAPSSPPASDRPRDIVDAAAPGASTLS
jgi:hypothetical protein